MANIFNLTRKVVTIEGIPLVQKNSLTPIERIDLQEKFYAAKDEFNRSYYNMILQVQKACNFKSEAESYGAVKSYYAGKSEHEDVNNAIELISLANPVRQKNDVELEELTYLLNARIDRATFPYNDFQEAFGLTFDTEWTLEHTFAVGELLPAIREFFNREMNPEGTEETEGTEEKENIEGKS